MVQVAFTRDELQMDGTKRTRRKLVVAYLLTRLGRRVYLSYCRNGNFVLDAGKVGNKAAWLGLGKRESDLRRPVTVALGVGLKQGVSLTWAWDICREDNRSFEGNEECVILRHLGR